MEFPLLISSIFDAFLKKDYELYFIGGASRAILEGKELPFDIDFSTNATPNEVLKLLQEFKNGKIITYGIDYGTVIFNNGIFNIEITTTRSDINCYGRDAKVKFCNSFEEDSNRRDFTINAIYIDRDFRILDFHNGIFDLKNRRIIFIGNPEDRIKEDYLRILRYFRFVCFYSEGNFDNDVVKICIKLKDGLKNLSMERMNSELFKMINYPNSFYGFFKIVETGILDFLFPKMITECNESIPSKLLCFSGKNPIIKLIFFVINIYPNFLEILENFIQIGFISKKEEIKQLRFFIKNSSIFGTPSFSNDEKIIIFDNLKIFKDYEFILLFPDGLQTRILNFLNLCKKIDMEEYLDEIKNFNGQQIKEFYYSKKVEMVNSIEI